MESFKKFDRKIVTEFQYPVEYFEGNMLFKKDKTRRVKECWAVYRLRGFTYNFKSKREKFKILNSMTKLFWTIKNEFQIRGVPRTSSIREDNEKMKKRVTGPLKIEAIREIDAETQDLTEILGDEGNDYEWYLIVKLENPKTLFQTVKEFVKSVYQDPIRMLNEYAGFSEPEIYLREFEAYKRLEETMYNRISKNANIERADEYMIQYLIRQQFYFGIGEPPMRGEKPKKSRFRIDKTKTWKPHGEIIEVNGEKVIRPHKQSILSLTEGEIDISHMRHLEITQFYKGKERKAYHSYIVVSDIPDLPFPGGEWIYNLISSMEFALNISIRCKTQEYKASLSEVRKKQRELADQGENIQGSNNAMPLDLLESNEEAYLMEYDLKNKKFPLLNTTIVIGVSAKELDTLHRRVEDIRNYLDEIQTECPAGDQFLLFNEVLLGGEQYAYDYIQKLTPEHLAGAMIGATTQLGDELGVYIGITGTLFKPVKVDLWKPSRIHRPPNVILIGPQGGGKSFLADLLALKTAKRGGKVLIIDPKGDRWKWEQDLYSFGDQVKVITFTADMKDKGKIDPFNIMRVGITKENYIERMKEAANWAMDICMFLIAADRKDPRTTILLQAVNRVVNKPKPAMNKIIDEIKLMAKEAEQEENIIKRNMCNEIAETLNSYKQMAYASLLFGDGDEDAISLERTVNVLQIQNLVFPDAETSPENYTFQEIVGYACLLAITGYIMLFIMSDRKELSIFEMDEATVLRSTAAGKNIANKIIRMARALQAPGIFISQSVDDIGDSKVLNNIGYKFAFRTSDEKEIIKTLEAFGIEPTEENKEILSNLETGVCLFQDLEGRTGIVAIDAVFEEYKNAFKTGAEDKEET